MEALLGGPDNWGVSAVWFLHGHGNVHDENLSLSSHLHDPQLPPGIHFQGLFLTNKSSINAFYSTTTQCPEMSRNTN